jgi:broad specificity phosphatase PhoE
MTATLYIVRHGQTEWNLASRMQGRLDSPLTEAGRAQADMHGRTLARLGGVDVMVASPLGRTRATADLMGAHLNTAARFEPALMERDCGAWSGMTLAEIEAAFPGDWQARAANPYDHRPPGGENLVDMEARIGGFVDGLVAEILGGAGRSVALVTHGVMSRVLLKRLLRLTPAVAAQVRHPNDLFYRLDIRNGDAPRSIDSAHYIAGEGPRRGLLHHGLLHPDGGETIQRSE